MKDKKSNSISQSEAEVLQVLWEKSPQDGKQIAANINNKSWSFVTVKTLINRLLKKGFLSYEKRGRAFLYSPTISEEDYLKRENKQFLNRLYGGSLSGLFASFSEQEEISPQELQDIKAIIKQMEKGS